MRADRKMTLAVTGGIGSGKSLVCSILGRNGFPVYDSDSRTKDLYLSVPGLSGRISDALGIDLCCPDGTLDRAGLAAVVFSDPDKLRLLESIVYPEVKADFLKWKENTPEDCMWVVMESAVILEKPFFRDLIDKVLLVDAPVKLRLERTMERDRSDAETVGRRMASQRLFTDISEGRRRPDADFVIVNDGDESSLERKVEAFCRNILPTK